MITHYNKSDFDKLKANQLVQFRYSHEVWVKADNERWCQDKDKGQLTCYIRRDLVSSWIKAWVKIIDPDHTWMDLHWDNAVYSWIELMKESYSFLAGGK